MCVSFLLLQVEKSGETPEKEQIELKEGEEKKDDSTEKDKKKKKEKKVKEPKEKGPNCIDLISKDLDLGNRDSNNVNVEIDVSHACTAHFKTLKEGGNNDEGKGSSRVCAIFMKQQLHPHRVMTFFLSIFFFFWLLPSSCYSMQHIFWKKKIFSGKLFDYHRSVEIVAKKSLGFFARWASWWAIAPFAFFTLAQKMSYY